MTGGSLVVLLLGVSEVFREGAGCDGALGM